MTHRFRGFIAAALISTASGSALAQTPPAPARAASGGAAAPASLYAAGSGYRSAFDGYRRFGEQKVLPWREANDLVGRIGGWQAYARESAGGEAMPAGHDMPMPAQAASQPASSPHHGHTQPKTP